MSESLSMVCWDWADRSQGQVCQCLVSDRFGTATLELVELEPACPWASRARNSWLMTIVRWNPIPRACRRTGR